jgi:serine/threonine-protein kinase RsbW
MLENRDGLRRASRAAREAARSAGKWWQDLDATAGAALTDDALDRLFAGALGAARDLLGADEASILLADDRGARLVARASVGLDEQGAATLDIPAGSGMAGTVLASGRPAVFPDLSAVELASPTLRELGFRSAVAVPLVSGERVVGVMHAGSRRPGAFEGADAELLVLVADRLALALERARLFAEERRQRLAAEALAERLGRIQRLTSSLAATSSAEEVAEVVTRSLDIGPPGQPGVAPAILWLVAPEAPEGLRSVGSEPAGASDLARHVVAANRPLVRSAGPDRSRVAVPVALGTEMLGALELEIAGSAGDEELSFLAVVAEQVAQSLLRVRMFAEQAQLSAVGSFFARAARVMAEASGLESALERLASVALDVLGDICLIDLVEESGTVRRVVAQHRNPALQPLVARLRLQPPDPAGHHPAVEVMREGRARWSATMGEEFLHDTTRSAEHLQLTRLLGFASYLSVPLLAGSEVIGAVSLVSSGAPFGPGDVAFAERLAEQVAAVVGNARRYEATFQTSHLLQQSLLPRSLPEVPGLEVQTRYLAASSGLDVGGDFYDLLVLPSGRTGLMVGDVAGHDGDAAAMMGHLRSAARALAGQVREPDQLVAALQWSWPLLGFDRIATGLFGRLGVGDGDLVLASAGHYPPLVLSGGAASFLDVVPGPPLGALPAGERDEQTTSWRGTLQIGEVLLCYTDGAIDERRSGIDASMARLAEVAASGPATPAALCDRVIGMLSGDRRPDDVALLALRRLDGPATTGV